MATEDSVSSAVDPLLHSVDLGIAHPNMMTELAFSLVIAVLMISVHGWCLSSVSRRFAVSLDNLPRDAAGWRVSLLVSVTIASLALVHLMETLIWVVPIWWSGLIPTFRDSYLYVLEAYTTLGKGQVALPKDWQLVGPMIAISGLFTFSWTGSVLVYVMSESSKRHAHRAQAERLLHAAEKVRAEVTHELEGTPKP
jgi:hypothetical protein